MFMIDDTIDALNVIGVPLNDINKLIEKFNFNS